MVAKFSIWILIFICIWFSSFASTQVGFIVKKEDEKLVSVVEHVLNTQVDGSDRNSNIRILKEIVEKDDAASYHRAICRLLAQGIVALLSPATATPYYLLAEYSTAYHIPFITTDLPEPASRHQGTYAIGIRPSTTRAILNLFQIYGWRDFVYLYDHEYGPKNLQMIFVLGYRAINFTSLDGIKKVDSAEEANWYLQILDKSYDNKLFHVILDVDPNMAREIIRKHVHDIYVRKKNFNFLLAQPTQDHFWAPEKTSFGAISVTTFLTTNQLPETKKTSLEAWMRESEHDSNTLSYYYYDAALVLLQMVDKLSRSNYRVKETNTSFESRQCLEQSPAPVFNKQVLDNVIKGINIMNGVTGRINFLHGLRNNFDLNVTQISSGGYHRIGTYSNGILRLESSFGKDNPETLSLIGERRLRIATKIKPPFMMMKKSENGVNFDGTDSFEGYLKDVIDLLAVELNFEYDLKFVEDGENGIFNEETKEWSGIIGEIIQGKADLGVADIAVTGKRHRVVDFTDPFEMVGFSLVMKNPLSIPATSSMFFFLTAFTADVWVCILIAVIVFGILFHIITKFTGAPDSIESASGIWGRKHTMIVNAWFSIGSSLFQGTGVYPRSISSRVLSGVFWFFTLILSALFIASIAAQILTGKQLGDLNPQLIQLRELSMEAIISESLSRGWPKVGIHTPSVVESFVKSSKLPTFVKYAEYIEKNPDIKFETIEEGVRRVRESAGDYMILLESLTGEYVVHQKPCDLVATHDSVPYTGYGLATPQGSELSSQLNIALNNIISNGTLGSLHRKWWIDTSQCKVPSGENIKERTVHVFTGLLCVSAIGFLVVLVVFGIQYIRKNQNKESRRQQLSFEDMNLGQTFPQPPPELLAEPAPVLNVPEYDRKTLL